MDKTFSQSLVKLDDSISVQNFGILPLNLGEDQKKKKKVFTAFWFYLSREFGITCLHLPLYNNFIECTAKLWALLLIESTDLPVGAKFALHAKKPKGPYIFCLVSVRPEGVPPPCHLKIDACVSSCSDWHACKM